VKTTLRDKKNSYGYGESSDNSRYNLRIATVASHSDAFDIIQKLPEELQDKVLVDIISDEDAAALQSTDEEISVALDGAIDAAINKILTQRKLNMA
jgi:hypothetical protein